MQLVWKLAQVVLIVGITAAAQKENPSAPVGGHLFAAVIFTFALTGFLSSLFGWCGRTIARLRGVVPEVCQPGRDSSRSLTTSRFPRKLLK